MPEMDNLYENFGGLYIFVLAEVDNFLLKHSRSDGILIWPLLQGLTAHFL